MPILYLLRHAKSDWPGSVPDRERPLAERGRKAAPAMAGYMKAQDLVPELVLCSPAVRARETWDLMDETIGQNATVIWDEELYGASCGTLLEILARLPGSAESAMIVGHNPGMEDVAARLAGSGTPESLERLRRKFPTAALAVLRTDASSWEELGPGTCSLERFVWPKDLPGAEDRGL